MSFVSFGLAGSLGLAGGSFGLAGSFLTTVVSPMHSLLSDNFRLLFDLAVIDVSAAGLLGFLAASCAYNKKHHH